MTVKNISLEDNGLEFQAKVYEIGQKYVTIISVLSINN
jgi:hypothetical protein